MSSPSADSRHIFDEVDSEEPLMKLPATLNPLLTSNDPPTQLQRNQILAVETKLLFDLLNAESHIHRYKGTIVGLRALQAKQRHLLRTCKGINSLVRSLPCELLSRIFVECIPEGGVTISQPPVPMVLCQVCSRWRSVVLTTPQLWNQLTTIIGPALPKPSYSRTLVKQTLDSFDRAKTLPLTLKFTSHLAHYTGGRRDSQEWLAEEALVPFSLLHPLADRLQFLDLQLVSGWALFYFRSFPLESQFPKLESLILRRTEESSWYRAPDWFTWGGKKPLVKTFQNATRLRRVAMYYPVSGDNIGDIISFPWKQLTHFIISEQIPHSVFEHLLRSCVNLQQGVFDLTDVPHSTPPRKVKTVQPHLVDLTVTTYRSFNPGILRNFILPALQNLRLGPWISPDSHQGERHLLYPHLSSIRRLSFQAHDMSHKTVTCNHIVELLQCAPNVERLDLCPGVFYPNLMEALTVNKFSIPILPNLHSLSVDFGMTPSAAQAPWKRLRSPHHPKRYSALALGEMVKSRRSSGGTVTCLKELHIYIRKEDSAISKQIGHVLEAHIREGLVVDERSSDNLAHWSTHLEDEEVSWPEGLSVFAKRERRR